MKTKIKYGWKRDLPDHRDLKLTIQERIVIPSKIDLRSGCTPVYDQGQLGSCTANAIGAALDFDRVKQGETPITPSRLFIYYNERALEGSIRSDAGASIRDGIKTVKSLGACPEKTWPYIISKFKTKPSTTAFNQALSYQSVLYQSVDNTNLTLMKSTLASGFPVIGGFSVYESFESDTVASTGIVPMPSKTEQLLGGHAILVVGYDDSTQRFIVRNSWGTNWGKAGYFTVPYAYFTNPQLASDFWVVQKVE